MNLFDTEIAALNGIHCDEQAAIALGPDATEIPQIPVDAAIKSNGADVPLGFFLDDSNSEISAVIYSGLATWEKFERSRTIRRPAQSTNRFSAPARGRTGA